MSLFIEESIINSIKTLLTGRVNELLGEVEWPIPPIEFSSLLGSGSVSPEIRLVECERTEKDRIIRLDVYSLTVTFTLPDPEGERNSYAYASAVGLAVGEDPTLGGIADRAVLTGKKYVPPKKPHCGEGWEVILTMRLTLEGMNNAG
jgi:hypothetical protein